MMAVFSGCELLDPNPEATVTRAPADTSIAVPHSGKELFQYWCAGCHGIRGHAVGNDITSLQGYTGTFDVFDAALTQGPGIMPRFPQLDSSMRHLIFDYIKTFE